MLDWKNINDSETPKDGTKVMIWSSDETVPVVGFWEEFDEDLKEETGEDGFWCYAEELIANIGATLEPTHWAHYNLPE